MAGPNEGKRVADWQAFHAALRLAAIWELPPTVVVHVVSRIHSSPKISRRCWHLFPARGRGSHCARTSLGQWNRGQPWTKSNSWRRSHHHGWQSSSRHSPTSHHARDAQAAGLGLLKRRSTQPRDDLYRFAAGICALSFFLRRPPGQGQRGFGDSDHRRRSRAPADASLQSRGKTIPRHP